MKTLEEVGRRGRARDPSIDDRVLSVAGRHLALHGYEAMSLAAVAEEAATSRQALYRRWPNKAALVEAVVGTMADRGEGVSANDPFRALVTELADFQRGVSRPGRLSLAATMLQDNTEPEVVARYQARVVAPRRARLRNILEQAQHRGLVDADADLEVAVTMCTGCWYGRALSGASPPPQWPHRTASLVWRAVGGEPPITETTKTRRRP